MLLHCLYLNEINLEIKFLKSTYIYMYILLMHFITFCFTTCEDSLCVIHLCTIYINAYTVHKIASLQVYLDMIQPLELNQVSWNKMELHKL